MSEGLIVAQQMPEHQRRHTNVPCHQVWVARSRTNPELMYVLDYILERKSITDLAMSIRDQVRAECFINAAPGDAPGPQLSW